MSKINAMRQPLKENNGSLNIGTTLYFNRRNIICPLPYSKMNLWFHVETFGPINRPIVEFAIDNVQTLKLRKAKLQAWSQDNTANVPKAWQGNANTDTIAGDVHSNKNNSRKRKAMGDNRSVRNKDENDNHVSNDVAMEENRAIKKRKTRPEIGNTNKSLRQKPEGRRSMPEKSINRSVSMDSGKIKASQEADVQHKKKVKHQVEQQRKRPKKNKEPIGRDVVDKLDVLIEQYRSKFLQQRSDRTDGEKKGSKQVRRWFQS